ncbi:hypothetical protein OG474_39900 [Kribbella sp. NBC_01505]|uniref:hypothetical protein n=1 Tax=Kribbella sp. NBC_01505 TaxID=2903580 RepID=UPI00386B629B
MPVVTVFAVSQALTVGRELKAGRGAELGRLIAGDRYGGAAIPVWDAAYLTKAAPDGVAGVHHPPRGESAGPASSSWLRSPDEPTPVCFSGIGGRGCATGGTCVLLEF